MPTIFFLAKLRVASARDDVGGLYSCVHLAGRGEGDCRLASRPVETTLERPVVFRLPETNTKTGKATWF